MDGIAKFSASFNEGNIVYLSCSNSNQAFGYYKNQANHAPTCKPMKFKEHWLLLLVAYPTQRIQLATFCILYYLKSCPSIYFFDNTFQLFETGVTEN
jgi:hypothetical protein